VTVTEACTCGRRIPLNYGRGECGACGASLCDECADGSMSGVCSRPECLSVATPRRRRR
jgi:hypothetical protein